MELLTRIQENWIVLLIPLISAVVGWFTNVVAIKMMIRGALANGLLMS